MSVDRGLTSTDSALRQPDTADQRLIPIANDLERNRVSILKPGILQHEGQILFCKGLITIQTDQNVTVPQVMTCS